jgi:hypothetical protein
MKTDSISAIRHPSCHEFLRRLEEVKKSLERDFGGALETRQHLLDLTLNEAEALAWLTPFPDLLFPVLAEEMTLELKQWATRQQALQRVSGLNSNGLHVPTGDEANLRLRGMKPALAR